MMQTEVLHKQSADSRKIIHWLNLWGLLRISSLLERCRLSLIFSELPEEFDFDFKKI